jgi:hypothetical protein
MPVKTMSVRPTGNTRPSTRRKRPGLLVLAEGEPPTTASRKPPYLDDEDTSQMWLGDAAWDIHSRQKNTSPYRLQKQDVHPSMVPRHRAFHQSFRRLLWAQRRMVRVVLPVRVLRVVVAYLVNLVYDRCLRRITWLEGRRRPVDVLTLHGLLRVCILGLGIAVQRSLRIWLGSLLLVRLLRMTIGLTVVFRLECVGPD